MRDLWPRIAQIAGWQPQNADQRRAGGSLGSMLLARSQ